MEKNQVDQLEPITLIVQGRDARELSHKNDDKKYSHTVDNHGQAEEDFRNYSNVDAKSNPIDEFMSQGDLKDFEVTSIKQDNEDPDEDYTAP